MAKTEKTPNPGYTPTNLMSAPIEGMDEAAETYRRQKFEYDSRVLAGILAGVPPEKQKEYEELIYKYRDMERKLAQMQTDMNNELEKTGRVNTTAMSNLMASIAKMYSANVMAQGGVKEAAFQQTGKLLDLETQRMEKYGAKSPAQLSQQQLSEVDKIRALIGPDGHVRDSAAFTEQVNGLISTVAATDPTYVIPMLEKIQTETNIPLIQIYGKQAGFSGVDGMQYGVPSESVKGGLDAYKKGIEAHAEGVRVNQDAQIKIGQHAQRFFEQVGYVPGIALSKSYNQIIENVPGFADLTTRTSGYDVATAPPADAPDDAKALWIKNTFGGQLEYRDGKVYEKVDDKGTPGVLKADDKITSIDYGTLVNYPASYRDMMRTVGTPYLQEMRSHIHDKIQELENSDAPDFVKTRAHITSDPRFQDWAKKRGYMSEDGTTQMPAKDMFKSFMDEQRASIASRQEAFQFAEYANKAFNPEVAATPQERENARRYLKQKGITEANYKEFLTPGSPAAKITSGAQSPEAAADIPESKAGDIIRGQEKPGNPAVPASTMASSAAGGAAKQVNTPIKANQPPALDTTPIAPEPKGKIETAPDQVDAYMHAFDVRGEMAKDAELEPPPIEAEPGTTTDFKDIDTGLEESDVKPEQGAQVEQPTAGGMTAKLLKSLKNPNEQESQSLTERYASKEQANQPANQATTQPSTPADPILNAELTPEQVARRERIKRIKEYGFAPPTV